MNAALRQALTDALLAANADAEHAAQENLDGSLGTYGYILEALKQLVSEEDLEAAHCTGCDWDSIDADNAAKAEREQQVQTVREAFPDAVVRLRTYWAASGDRNRSVRARDLAYDFFQKLSDIVAVEARLRFAWAVDRTDADLIDLIHEAADTL